jgi:MEMO1 family protein
MSVNPMINDRPKLRYGLEANSIDHENQRMILISDRLGLSDNPLVISPLAANLLAKMDGENSLRDLQAHFMRTTGQMLYMEDLQEFVHKLDESCFLDNDRFRELIQSRVSAFLEDPVRPMQFAGKAYPADAQELRGRLDSFFSTGSGGPGLPFQTSPSRRLLGLVAPHIDLNAGGTCFAHAYKALSEAVSPDTWVILGTGHEPIEHHFALTVKDFETPLGLVPCDRELAHELERLAPRDLRASEYNHLREHSVEFQAVFLSHLQPHARIVPLLCSFSLEDAETDREYIDHIAGLMRDLARSGERSVGFMASVDLAHIGPRYGDRFRPSNFTIQEHLEADGHLLDLLARSDSEGFMQKLLSEQNRRRICGMGPLYVLAKILEGQVNGELLQHTRATVDDQGSFVTFASMAFYEALATG